MHNRVVGLLAALALASCASINDVDREALVAGGRYVAMGSSFAAGPQLGRTKENTPPRCTRDLGNYPTLLAERLKLDLVDATCSRATTAHVLGPWNELPAQIDALTPDTRLVTITIGGNDVNYVRNLYAMACPPLPAGQTCPSVMLPVEADWAKLKSGLRKIAQEVRARAPKAKLVFVDYVTLVPGNKVCASVPLQESDAETMHGIAARLAAMTASVARESGATLIEAGALSRNHTACDTDPWSAGMSGMANEAPWHPNAAGMRGIADALAAELHGR